MAEVWIKIDLNWLADTRAPAESPNYTDTPAYKTSLKGYTVPVHIPWGQPWTNADHPEEYLVTEEEARLGSYLGGTDGSFWVGGGYSRMVMGSYTVHGPESWLDWWVVLEAKVVDLRLSQPPDVSSKLVTIDRYDYFFERPVSFSSLDYVWRLVEAKAGELFTPKSDSVNLNKLKPQQILAVDDGEDLYSSLTGNDFVTLPNSALIPGTSKSWAFKTLFNAGAGDDTVVGSQFADKIDGGPNEDVLWGGKGSDKLVGGTGNDVLRGGPDEDTFVFRSTKFVNEWDRFDLARNLQFNLDGTKVTNRDGDGEVVLSSPGEGLDFIQDGEIVQFQNGKQDLSAMKVIIERTPDGHAKGEVWDNGVLDKKLTALISGEVGPSTKPLKDMLWDTLTPIAAKSYSGHYRNDGTLLGERIELSGWSNGEGKVVEVDIVRSNIQIHAGRNNGQSEGCFLVSGTFRNALFDHLKGAVEGIADFKFNAEGRFYPVIPVVIEVEGKVPQTKIMGIDDTVARPLSGNGAVEATIGFDVREFGLEHHLKSIDLFFTAKADGKGWKLPAKLLGSEPASGGASHGRIWREDTDGGDAVYGIRIGVANDIMRSQVKFDVPIGAGSPSKIDFKIVDLDLWTKSSKGWGLYGVSKDKNDTDGANGAEQLLLEGLKPHQLTSTITVTPSKLPALAAEPDDAVVVASIGTFADDFLF